MEPYGPALEALVKIVLPMFMGLMVLLRVMSAGADRANKKIQAQELKDRDEFEKRGEEWDGMGGLGGIVRRRLRK